MKVTFLVLVIFSLGLLSGLGWQKYWMRPEVKAAKVERTEVVKQPVWVVIPKIGVRAAVEQVELDEEGNMAAPALEENVGWYKLGNKPGEKGSAVIAGHFDDEVGPAVFYELDKLEIGDLVMVEDGGGRIWGFEVMGKQVYEEEEFPVELVFNRKGGKNLNLITCDGVFDEREEDYSERLVVFTRLIE